MGLDGERRAPLFGYRHTQHSIAYLEVSEESTQAAHPLCRRLGPLILPRFVVLGDHARKGHDTNGVAHANLSARNGSVSTVCAVVDCASNLPA